MVPRNGYAQKDQEKQKMSWCAAWFRGFIKFFRDIGLGDAEQKLVFTLVGLTENDELAWRSCSESVEAFEASRNDIPFMLEISRSGPVLFTTHADIKSRVVKGVVLDLLVESVFRQEARNHRREETHNFDPDEEFNRVLLPRYKDYVQKRAK